MATNRVARQWHSIEWMGLAAVMLLAASGIVHAQRSRTAQPTPPLALETLGGTESYVFYCAPCHGRTGTGDGPVAAALRVPPADLTTLSERYGDVFPRERLVEYITGAGRPIAAHGAGDMPIWGPTFRSLDASDVRAKVRIGAIIDHIETLQGDSGAALFREHCATCHGISGRGNGPIVAVLRVTPPDLTKFAARNGGVFPSERLGQIIDGRNILSHGNREMPLWGEVFRQTAPDGSNDVATARVRVLVRYLRSIQERSAE